MIERTGVKAAEFYFGFEPPAFVDQAGRQFTATLVIHNTLRKRQIETTSSISPATASSSAAAAAAR